jgi:hypothetical protein
MLKDKQNKKNKNKPKQTNNWNKTEHNNVLWSLSLSLVTPIMLLYGSLYCIFNPLNVLFVGQCTIISCIVRMGGQTIKTMQTVNMVC